MSARPMVCVIDDEAPVRASLESLLRVAGYEVMTFPSAERFLESISEVPPGAVVLADVYMPGVDGIELTERLRPSAGRGFPVIIMTGHGSMRMAVDALRAGAVDFVEKPFSREELFAALERALARGGMPAAGEVPAGLTKRLESLSRRESQVMTLMISGESSKAIGRQLGISPRTVEVHRSQVLRKMAARNLAELIHMAARLGMGPGLQ